MATAKKFPHKKESNGIAYARQCSITGEGMNEGWIVEDASLYFKYQKDAAAWAKAHGYKSLENAYKADEIYWTEWTDTKDYQYVVMNGKLIDIEDYNGKPIYQPA